MDINQVRLLAKRGESRTLEYKTSTAQLRDAFETVCSFLNGQGGTILIGVANNGQVLGQNVTDNTRQEIAREIKKIEPAAQIDIDYVPLQEDKYIIVVKVAAGKHIPYVYDSRPYERTESSKGRMTQHRYEQLIVQRGQLNHSWEEKVAEDCDLDALDYEEIRRTVREGVDQNRIGVEVLNYDVEHILSKLKLIRDGKIINAAAVLYAKDVLPQYQNCMIRMARFRGIDKLGDFIDNQRVYGNAFHLISAANDFAQRHLPIASFFEPGKMQRIDQPAVPALAFREALINSISHRDYTNHSASIALAIFDDRLEIWNNGELPPQLKIEDLRKPHQSFPRNEEIASIFYKRGWVEGWGTGTVRMITYCQKNGTPEPEFQEYSGGFSVMFRFKESMGSIKKPAVVEKHVLNIRQEKILEVLGGGKALSAQEIFDQLGSISSLRTIKADLAVLKKTGLVEQVGQGRAAIWKGRR